jgi:hypothetical protein
MAHLFARGYALPVFFLAGIGAIGFLLSCVNIDVLHCVDQGISSHIIGNIMWYNAVVRGHLGGGTYAQRIDRLNARMKQWYKDIKCKSRVIGDLTVERLRTNKLWPKFKAKAAATRHLARFAFELMAEFSNPDHHIWGEHDVLAQGVCQLLVRFSIGFEQHVPH